MVVLEDVHRCNDLYGALASVKKLGERRANTLSTEHLAAERAGPQNRLFYRLTRLMLRPIGMVGMVRPLRNDDVDTAPAKRVQCMPPAEANGPRHLPPQPRRRDRHSGTLIGNARKEPGIRGP